MIPARGGSKGIKRKNLQCVGGIPLLERTIKAAQSSKNIDKVYVSSDCNEILENATLNGAIAIKRSKDLSRDDTSTDPVLIHALENIETKEGRVNLFLLLQCTSPFTTADEIDHVVNIFKINRKEHDAAFAAHLSHSFIWKYDEKNKKSSGLNHASDKPRKRRQDINSKIFKELGSVYVIERDALINSKSRFGTNPLPVNVETLNQYLEIDEYKDLDIANTIAKNQYKENIGNLLSCKIKKIKAVVMDFDGVFTNNMVTTDCNGKETVYCSKYDSLGISLIRNLGIELFVITSELHESITYRLKKLNINYVQSIEEKSKSLNNFMRIKGYSREDILYIGNDSNDISVKSLTSIFVCPNDSHKNVLEIADLITKNSGGRGCIREVCDLITNLKEKH
ncbi:N-Acetylneuraminate cytidylyltransferase [Prochlorococcus sp. MIT 0602]|nr:N-Acetylneuraminate cytidylyltransferase [Prochlorococcus sp. MIT 0602]KGG15623.1 N-Acetylneuraminate cytidylyltransferase [Prochlorococcus sp. MIT 0603]